MRVHQSLPKNTRRRPVAAAIAGALALAASGPALAATWTVDNTCVDDVSIGDVVSKTGTLRFCAANAASGDSIDLSQTTCSQITLTTGAITIAQSNLSLHGLDKAHTIISGKDGLSVDTDRIFKATYAGGYVAFDHLSIAFGLYSSAAASAKGGCVYGKGAIVLDSVDVHDCSTTTLAPASIALGGGVYAQALTMKNGSSLRFNGAYATQADGQAQGGGAAVAGQFTMSDSWVLVNSAAVPAGSHGAFGGGLELGGTSAITRALIANNHSSFDGGGIDFFTKSPISTATITNSTITMNGSSSRTGGIDTNFSATTIANSTIAFNTAPNYFYGPPLHFYSPGVAVNYRGSVGPPTLTLQGSIIANNTSLGVPNDLSGGAGAAKVTIAGANNLVRAFGSDVSLPAGQGNLAGQCPLLGPLRDNGGTTSTHALSSGSPGVGAGNNTVDDPLAHATALYDQRGVGFARSIGGFTDMGAFQRQGELLFDGGFEGCP